MNSCFSQTDAIEARIERAQGCLLGQLAGDSLGSIVEFMSGEDIRRLYPQGLRRLKHGGVWNTLAGQPTDDSEMALLLARYLAEHGSYDADAVFDRYRWWFASDPFDYGMTIMRALQGNPDEKSQANGALMRVSPIGIAGSCYSHAETVRWAEADAMLTHPNILCRQANALFTMAIAEAVNTGPDPDALYQEILSWIEERETEYTLAKAVRLAADGPPADYSTQSGWVIIALHNALYRLLYAAGFEDGVVDTVMQGGDSDTNAAVCGALLGAVYGINSIPDQWKKCIQSCRPQAGKDGVYNPRPSELWPVDALELAAVLVTRKDC